MNNLGRLKKGIIDLYAIHGKRDGYDPETIAEMLFEIDFWELYQCLRYSVDTYEIPHYLVHSSDEIAYISNLIFPEEVFFLYSVTDYDRKEEDCRVRHSIHLVVREDMSLAVLTSCETVIGDGEYCSIYREQKEEWPSEVVPIDLEELHKCLLNVVQKYGDEVESWYFEP